MDEEDWGDPTLLDEDADSLALSRLEDEFRRMAPGATGYLHARTRTQMSELYSNTTRGLHLRKYCQQSVYDLLAPAVVSY